MQMQMLLRVWGDMSYRFLDWRTAWTLCQTAFGEAARQAGVAQPLSASFTESLMKLDLKSRHPWMPDHSHPLNEVTTRFRRLKP